MTEPSPFIATATSASGLAELVRHVAPVRAHTLADVVRDRFTGDQMLLALPVVGADGAVVGILNRFRFLERLSARFGRELAARKAVSDLMEPALVIEEQTPLDEVGSVIAEGVETEAQRSVLAASGCDYAQGYWLGRPQPAEQFTRLLERAAFEHERAG